MPKYIVEETPTRDQVRARIFLFGPTGAGKSRGALELASRLYGGELPVGLVNTELGRGKLYADRYPIANYVDMAEIGDFGPEDYMAALDAIEGAQGGGIYIIDSVSHEWVGKMGILQQADRFGDWKTVRPKHNSFVERLMAVNGHLIVTVRAKMKYEVSAENDGNRERQVIRALGVGPVQSDDLQYEFNLVGNFEQGSHECRWSGHVDPLVDTTSNFADEESAAHTATVLTRWLSEGNEPPPMPDVATEESIDKLIESLTSEVKPDGTRFITDTMIAETFEKARSQARGVLTADWVTEQQAKSEERLAAFAKKKAKAEKEAKAEAAQATLDGGEGAAAAEKIGQEPSGA